MAIVAATERLPDALSEGDYRHAQGLHWGNAVTRALMQATGDPYVCAAYDPRRECWVLGRHIKITVRGDDGGLTVRDGRYPWLEWRDENRVALSPTDPRLIPHVLYCARGAEVLKDIEAGEAEKDAARKSRIRDVASSMARDDTLRRVIGRLGDDDGYVHHRRGGHEGGKISTASLWRTGAANKAKQTHAVA